MLVRLPDNSPRNRVQAKTEVKNPKTRHRSPARFFGHSKLERDQGLKKRLKNKFEGFDCSEFNSAKGVKWAHLSVHLQQLLRPSNLCLLQLSTYTDDRRKYTPQRACAIQGFSLLGSQHVETEQRSFCFRCHYSGSAGKLFDRHCPCTPSRENFAAIWLHGN